MTTEWTYNAEPINEVDPLFVGFIYIITQISTGKKYVGKKKLWFKKTALKTVTLKSGIKRKKKIRSLVPSDWRTYYGSSDALKLEIEKCGVDDFKREIIAFAETESMLSYLEAKEQFTSDCLLKPDEFFNSWIMVRVRRDHLIKKVPVCDTDTE